MNPFGSLLEGIFIDRPNRFIIHCSIDGKKVEAYLPNPGRLREILFPATRVLLTERPTGSPGRVPFIAVAAVKDNTPIMLHTHITNLVARHLIENGDIPAFRGYTVSKTEITHGRSRFDLLLEKKNEKIILEVKSCTLFHGGVAMFPDAITLRGKRHLEELSLLEGENRIRGGILFIAHSPAPRVFSPDYHTDLAFSETLLRVRKKIIVQAVSVGWSKNLTITGAPKFLHIPWKTLNGLVKDEGLYLLIINLEKDTPINVPPGGFRTYKRGYYVYVGSARKNLSRRIDRHRRKRKRLRWHIDHLLKHGRLIEALPIRSPLVGECELATIVKGITEGFVERFGSSDCGCKSHLFYKAENPLHDRRFVYEVLRLRTEQLSRVIG